MRKIIPRQQYLDQLVRWKDHQIIKVVTGIRRCGKSTLLMSLFKNHLLANGVSENEIIIIDLESIENEHLYNYRALYEHVVQRLSKDKMNYVIIDEVQNAVDFQKAIDSLYIKGNIDLYITGSNAKILSGDLATLLSGRYVTIEMLPLSFKEYKQANDRLATNEEHFRDYVRYGGFPYLSFLSDDKLWREYLEGIFNTVLKKDIIARRRISDIFVLEDLIKFVFDNVGNIISAKKISDTMSSDGRRISWSTVDSYLSYLVDSFSVYKVARYDIKGKEFLKSLEKYYVVDTGLRNYLLGFRDIDRGHIIENIVFLELKRRGYRISIGKYGDKEIDFVAQSAEEIIYIQVTESLQDELVLEREIAPLRAINDFHPRIIITTDYPLNKEYDGIKVVNLYDWLLQE